MWLDHTVTQNAVESRHYCPGNSRLHCVKVAIVTQRCLGDAPKMQEQYSLESSLSHSGNFHLLRYRSRGTQNAAPPSALYRTAENMSRMSSHRDSDARPESDTWREFDERSSNIIRLELWLGLIDASSVAHNKLRTNSCGVGSNVVDEGYAGLCGAMQCHLEGLVRKAN